MTLPLSRTAGSTCSIRGPSRIHICRTRLPDTTFYLVSTCEAVDRVEDFSSNLTATLLRDGDRTRVLDLIARGDRTHVLAVADDPIRQRDRKLALPALADRLPMTAVACVGLPESDVPRLPATHDDLQRAVRADRSLTPALPAETLRLESPFRGHHRHVVRDTTRPECGCPPTVTSVLDGDR